MPAFRDNNTVEEINLQEVEDYSSDSVLSGSHHDQLPSVEEARMHAAKTLAKSGSTGGKSFGLSKRLPRFSYRVWAAVGGVILVILGVSLAMRGGRQQTASLKESDPQTYFDNLITNQIALNKTGDFEEKYSYQSLAKRWMLQDDEILMTSTPVELQQRYALYCMVHATQLTVWTTESHNIPHCHWAGVTCTPNEGSNVVTRINLRDAGIMGDLPREMMLLDHLQVLNVKANADLSSVPDELCKVDKDVEIKIDCDTVVTCNCCYECVGSN